MDFEKSRDAIYSFFRRRQLQLNKECVTAFRTWLKQGSVCLRLYLDEFRQTAPAWWAERRLWMKDSVTDSIENLGTCLRELRTGERRVELPGMIKKPGHCAALLAGFLLLCGNYYLIQNHTAYAAYYQGEEIGFAASYQLGEGMLRQVQEELEQRLGQPVFLPAALTFKTTSASRTAVATRAQLRAALFNLPWQTDGVEVLVAGEPVFTLQNRGVAQRILNRVKDAYRKELAGEDIESMAFRERISFRNRKVAVSEVITENEALDLIKNGGTQVQSYVVKEGDSLWSIARAHDLMVQDLLDANPDLGGRLDINQEIKLAVVASVLNLEITSKVVARETIPFEVRTQLDTGLRLGSTKVIKDGAEGEQEVVYRIVRQNDRVVEKQVLTSSVLKEPVPKVVAKGTQRTVASAVSRGSGSGVLSWPISGSITSGYGSRRGGFHTGIDIAAGTGAPVHAAAGGRVIEAGWSGGYGKTVVVDHGNGLATRYAHLSRINVSGGSVDKGAVIGAVGSTGNSSGPHLHFEVMSNGSRANPMNYLR